MRGLEASEKGEIEWFKGLNMTTSVEAVEK